jgi:hypothetical protein
MCLFDCIKFDFATSVVTPCSIACAPMKLNACIAPELHVCLSCTGHISHPAWEYNNELGRRFPTV